MYMYSAFPQNAVNTYRVGNIQNLGNTVVHANFLHDQKFCYNYTRPRNMCDHARTSPRLFGHIGHTQRCLI